MTPLFAVYTEFGCKQDSGMRNNQAIPMYPKGRQREYKVSCCNASAEFMKASQRLQHHLDHLNFVSPAACVNSNFMEATLCIFG